MTLELLLRAAPTGADAAFVLCAPHVGVFTRALPKGAVVTPGANAGALLVLGRAEDLVVPAGATGRVISARPDRVHAPVGYGEVLYALAAFDGAEAVVGVTRADAPNASGALGVRAPYAGRFWGRSSPGDPPFVAPGDVLVAGTTVGMLEVMKTFSQLPYDPFTSLPERARVVRVLFADGAEVQTGDLLIEVEPA